MSQNLILTRDTILSVLSDQNFYKEVPEFFCLRRVGTEALQSYASATCPSCEKNKKLQLALSSFLHHLVSMHAFCGPNSLQSFQRYITKKLSYTPPEILVYHRVNQPDDKAVGLLVIKPLETLVEIPVDSPGIPHLGHTNPA